jgi:hypothetical protein
MQPQNELVGDLGDEHTREQWEPSEAWVNIRLVQGRKNLP